MRQFSHVSMLYPHLHRSKLVNFILFESPEGQEQHVPTDPCLVRDAWAYLKDNRAFRLYLRWPDTASLTITRSHVFRRFLKQILQTTT